MSAKSVPDTVFSVPGPEGFIRFVAMLASLPEESVGRDAPRLLLLRAGESAFHSLRLRTCHTSKLRAVTPVTACDLGHTWDVAGAGRSEGLDLARAEVGVAGPLSQSARPAMEQAQAKSRPQSKRHRGHGVEVCGRSEPVDRTDRGRGGAARAAPALPARRH